MKLGLNNRRVSNRSLTGRGSECLRYGLCYSAAAGRRQLEFTNWYLRQKQFIDRDENSRFVLTGAGVDYMEEHTPADKYTPSF